MRLGGSGSARAQRKVARACVRASGVCVGGVCWLLLSDVGRQDNSSSGAEARARIWPAGCALTSETLERRPSMTRPPTPSLHCTYPPQPQPSPAPTTTTLLVGSRRRAEFFPLLRPSAPLICDDDRLPRPRPSSRIQRRALLTAHEWCRALACAVPEVLAWASSLVTQLTRRPQTNVESCGPMSSPGCCQTALACCTARFLGP